MRTWARPRSCLRSTRTSATWSVCATRSEEHTSELQSQSNLVCRLLLEKKKRKTSFLDCGRDKTDALVVFAIASHSKDAYDIRNLLICKIMRSCAFPYLRL